MNLHNETEAGLKAVLFDLDGTLLPMDMDVFTGGYFKFLAKKAAPYGYEAKSLIDGVWHGTAAMVKNDGSRTNEEAFWEDFGRTFGQEKAQNDRHIFEEFYANDFICAKDFCGFNPLAAKAVYALKDKGIRVVLATNPIFPMIATQSRIRWAGLEPEDFELYTTYENIGYSKPNLEYYREVLRRIGLDPGECLMVGNDVSEDMVAEKLGMKVFLITDCVINKNGEDIDRYPHGGFEDLIRLIEEL